jgi:hypothetical protein
MTGRESRTNPKGLPPKRNFGLHGTYIGCGFGNLIAGQTEVISRTYPFRI